MKAREYLKQQGILFDKDTEFLPMADRFTGENGINDRVSNGIVFKPTEFTSE